MAVCSNINLNNEIGSPNTFRSFQMADHYDPSHSHQARETIFLVAISVFLENLYINFLYCSFF